MVFPQVIVFMTYLIFVLFNDSSGIYLLKDLCLIKSNSHHTELNCFLETASWENKKFC